MDALQGRFDALEVKLLNTQQELANEKAKRVSEDELDKRWKNVCSLLALQSRFLAILSTLQEKRNVKLKKRLLQQLNRILKAMGSQMTISTPF